MTTTTTTTTTTSTTSSLKNPSVFLHGAGNAQIADTPYPTIDDPYDVIVKIKYVGVCGSDVHFWTHGGIGTKVSKPLIMGHEASGTIHEVGPKVTMLTPGDRVAIEPGRPCQRCKTCKSGRYNLCPSMEFAACPPESHGTLTRYYKTAEGFCVKLSPDVGLDEGVLLEPLAVAVHCARLANIGVGMDVVVFGAGTIGLLCVAVAKAFGAKNIVAVDVNEGRLDFAGEFTGCDTFHACQEYSAEKSAQLLTSTFNLGDGAGANVVLEATGAETCIETGIQVLRLGGTFVQVGLSSKTKIQFPIVRFSEKEIRMMGCFRYSGGDFELAGHLVESKKVLVKELITGVEPFERATVAWERTKSGDGIKNLIRGPGDESV